MQSVHSIVAYQFKKLPGEGEEGWTMWNTQKGTMCQGSVAWPHDRRWLYCELETGDALPPSDDFRFNVSDSTC